jgi:hypothetical protein
MQCKECGAPDVKGQVTHRRGCSQGFGRSPVLENLLARRIADKLGDQLDADVMGSLSPRAYLAEIGRKGGKKRSARLTPEQRSVAARRAANARWKH